MIQKSILTLIQFYKKTETIRMYMAHMLHIAPGHCIFQPTCSEYMSDAIKKYGVVKGIWRGIGRLIRCRPGAKGGHDPA